MRTYVFSFQALFLLDQLLCCPLLPMKISTIKRQLAVLFLAGSLATTLPASAQGPDKIHCGTDEYHAAQLRQNPELLKNELKAQAQFSKQSLAQNKATDTTTKYIPVVFHIIHQYGTENISKNDILDQLKTMNENYRKKNADISKVYSKFQKLAADCHYEFRLATKDPLGRCTEGITRRASNLTYNADDKVKALDFWDNKKYLNIWVVKSINNNLTTQGIVLGYAQFPWDAATSAKTDGIVVIAQQVKADANTLTHEIGHWLGLYHTFQGGCTYGDGVDDTPPTANPNFGCPAGRNSCHNDNPDVQDMIENYMDYSYCQYMFTALQKDRMDNAASSYRANIYSYNNLKATGLLVGSQGTGCIPIADFTAKGYGLCEGASMQYTDVSYNAATTSWEWSFPGGTPSSSTDQNPLIKYNTAGTYSASLKVSNGNGSDTQTKNYIVTVIPVIASLKAPYKEGFEGGSFGSASMTTSQGGPGGTGFTITNSVAFSGSRSATVQNFGNGNNVSGNTYSFTLPPIDLSRTIEQRLRFYVAYANKDDQSNDYLRVFASKDCGNTFVRVYAKDRFTLPTVSSNQSAAFSPSSSSQWRKDSVSLSYFRSAPNLIIKFEFTSDGGNNIYIDDIGVGYTVINGINEAEQSSLTGLKLYPNPSTGDFSLSFEGDHFAPLRIQLIDMLGRTVGERSGLNMIQGLNLMNFTAKDFNISASGIYYLKLSTDKNSYTQKLIIHQ